jgi:hypothetical protein
MTLGMQKFPYFVSVMRNFQFKYYIKMNVAVLCGVEPCSLVETDRRFRGASIIKTMSDRHDDADSKHI